MSSRVSIWKQEHRTFDKLLVVLERQLKLFQRDASPSYELMLEIVNYMLDYGDRFHHPMEDLVFDMIGERVPDVREKIWELKREHADILQSGRDLAAGLEAVMGGTVVNRSVVEDRVQRYIDIYRRHIFAEEQAVVMEAAAKLSKKDWEIIGQQVQAGEDPLASERFDQRYSALRREIASEDR